MSAHYIMFVKLVLNLQCRCLNINQYLEDKAGYLVDDMKRLNKYKLKLTSVTE